MSWLNSAISTIAPVYALKREIAQNRLKRIQSFSGKRSTFDAIDGGRSRYNFLTTSQSADSATSGSRAALRQNIRRLEYNNGNVSGPIKRLRNNVVGTGIRFQSRVKAGPGISEEIAQRYNRDVEFWFKLWAKHADKRLRLPFTGIQGVIAMATPRDGEALVIGRISRRPGRIIPYCQEVLEIDRLQTPSSEIRNPKIKDGIEYDDEGVPLNYYILRHHPGDTTFSLKKDDEFEVVPAFFSNGTQKVMHIFDPIRAEQSRGYAELAAGLKDIQDADRYMEAEKLAALEDACLTGIVTTDDTVGFQSAFTTDVDSDDAKYDKIHEFAPNQVHYLRPGEKFETHRNSRPNTAFGEYIKTLGRGPANGLDVPPEVYNQDWGGMNYSNARTVLLAFYLSCRVRQQSLIEQYCTPTYEAVLPWLVSSGKVQTGGAYAATPELFSEHGWIPPGWQWVDPKKEADGKKIEVDNSMETLTAIAAAKGRDFEELAEERARELAMIKELEDRYGIKFTISNTGEPVAVQSEEDEDDGE